MGIPNDDTVNTGPPNPANIIKTASAFYESCTLFAACDAGIFKILHRLKQADAQSIAQHCELSEKGTRLLLNACVAIGLLEKKPINIRTL